MEAKKRIIVAISGASGAILGIEVLRALRTHENVETHLLISSLGKTTIAHETDYSLDQVKSLADYSYSMNALGALIASGSTQFSGMVVVPCSMKTLGGIASGYSENLLLRAADVCLKERRKLVLVPRETPLSGIHLRNLLFLHEQGVIILPAMLTFYNHPKSIQDLINHLVGKILNQFDLEFSDFQPWKGLEQETN